MRKIQGKWAESIILNLFFLNLVKQLQYSKGLEPKILTISKHPLKLQTC
jgi:hypothetical protein